MKGMRLVALFGLILSTAGLGGVAYLEYASYTEAVAKGNVLAFPLFYQLMLAAVAVGCIIVIPVAVRRLQDGGR